MHTRGGWGWRQQLLQADERIVSVTWVQNDSMSAQLDGDPGHVGSAELRAVEGQDPERDLDLFGTVLDRADAELLDGGILKQTELEG